MNREKNHAPVRSSKKNKTVSTPKKTDVEIPVSPGHYVRTPVYHRRKDDSGIDEADGSSVETTVANNSQKKSSTTSSQHVQTTTVKKRKLKGIDVTDTQ